MILTLRQCKENKINPSCIIACSSIQLFFHNTKIAGIIIYLLRMLGDNIDSQRSSIFIDRNIVH
jgi:hypothetical protein